MNLLIGLLAVSGIYFVLSQAELFGLISRLRGMLFRVPKLGPFFADMFRCPFCLGFWCSFIVFPFLESPRPIIFLWSLAAATFNWFIFKDIE